MTAPAYSQAELALRFRARQSMLAHCQCGARVPAGAIACSQHGGGPVAIHAKKPDNYTTFCAEKRARAGGRAYQYQPKRCAKPGCGTVFQPTGPRSLFCEGCR